MKKTLPPRLEKLLTALQVLPGVGPKSSQRMALYLLSRKRKEGMRLAEALQQAMQCVVPCPRCRNFSEGELCLVCQDERRDTSKLCIIESPHDLMAIESLQQYRGLYFVLLGRLSPIEGILPEQLGLGLLEERLKQEGFKELILATNPTVEGEVTAQFIATLAAKYQIPCSRIAHGIPMGSEIEQLDRLTLNYAFSGRKPMKQELNASTAATE